MPCLSAERGRPSTAEPCLFLWSGLWLWTLCDHATECLPSPRLHAPSWLCSGSGLPPIPPQSHWSSSCLILKMELRDLTSTPTWGLPFVPLQHLGSALIPDPTLAYCDPCPARRRAECKDHALSTPVALSHGKSSTSCGEVNGLTVLPEPKAGLRAE